MEAREGGIADQGSASVAKRPRVLWRGALILHDGTVLPGSKIVSYLQSWDYLTVNSSSSETFESDADLCLAVEMVRHQALCVRPPIPSPSNLSSASSGQIQLQLDPNYPFTVAYFEQRFRHNATDCIHLIYEPNVTENTTDLSLIHRSSLHGAGALQLTLVLRRRPASHLMDILVSRPAPMQPEREARTSSLKQIPRPDDPLPRTQSRNFARTSSSGDLAGSLLTKESTAQTSKRGSIRLASSGQPQQHGGHTPGRRGEKRRLSLRKTDSCITPSYQPVTNAVAPIGVAFEGNAEEYNRTLIKKLVRYQLAGAGLERGERDFDALFQATYAGTCVVFRKILSTHKIDSKAAARIIAAHLALYTNPEQLVLCAPKP
ncbi:hypothetical protein MYAM1_002958 [Malassezia yamatoensis]|uniref:Sld7 C-terminal domain-containing protein n=1 Tax=Malassezia yamatoensis TaxID=253288 RepID=A0AAJ5Z0X2_9BASI|nr:hypothetical protein MYAM1_002958 [Malassezia yamatoensis]